MAYVHSKKYAKKIVGTFLFTIKKDEAQICQFNTFQTKAEPLFSGILICRLQFVMVDRQYYIFCNNGKVVNVLNILIWHFPRPSILGTKRLCFAGFMCIFAVKRGLCKSIPGNHYIVTISNPVIMQQPHLQKFAWGDTQKSCNFNILCDVFSTSEK